MRTKTTTPRRRFAGLPEVPATRVAITDDLLGTRREFILPVEAEEALRSCSDIEQAWYFCDRLMMFGDGESMSLGVSLRRTAGSVSIHWFAVDGDVGKALQERDGEWDELQGGRY